MKKLVSALIIVTFMLSFTACGKNESPSKSTSSVPTLSEVSSDKQVEEEYTITKPYDYPIKAGTEEWKELASIQDRYDACQIPEEILNKMTTEALVETCANHPLAGAILHANPTKSGVDLLIKNFNGLQELDRREGRDGINKFIDRENIIWKEKMG